MKQIIFIRGGEAFDTEEQYLDYLKKRKYDPFDQSKSWKDWIEWALSDKYEMMAPVMPCKQNATYVAWKIWFEKLLPYLNEEELIVIGSSLGGTFLAKYLSENTFPKRISQLHLVAPVFGSEGLVDETIGDFAFDPNKLDTMEKQVDKIFLYASTDDPLVPISHCEMYKKYVPSTEVLIFQNRGHFFQPALPELLENIGAYQK
ncbi:MAG: hypothetical protein NTX91_00235 [candidate division SR1 bacterium]|nr:hypothetical protein [candidate division SR1 bacterium]